MTAVDAGPRFQPEAVTATTGTVVFFLHNVPGTLYSPAHNMHIGSNMEFFDDGSVRSGQVLAETPDVLANDTAIFTVKDLPAGTYVYWCSVEAGNANHVAYGMKGTLTITP
jgi:plastocyanin